jgi:hypothetical protein
MQDLVIGGLYKHYKDKEYRVIATACDAETLQEVVIYQALYDASGIFGKNAMWVRPKKIFLEDIEYNGKLIPRFMYTGCVTSLP